MFSANSPSRSRRRPKRKREIVQVWHVFFPTVGKNSNMAEKQIWQKIGESFIQEYYNQFDNTNRMDIANLYSPVACLTWEGSPVQGREAIAAKLVGLPFKRIKHVITEQDFQPTMDNCILIMAFGQLQADDDPPMAFHQVFMLKFQDNAWVCTNDVFRLGIHNIPV
ncbi:nuclear transport factor 2 [Oryzias latipes]|uniref:NTF2 domain-containing protein n=3 Tax=Oryzias TaxID=8089 RepID=A0A3B3I5Y5_ORYLA|nr:nuclear transport factor 2 [Oryzias latipes]